MRRIAFFILASALMTTADVAALAAPGDLDRSFGGDGKVTSDLVPGRDIAGALAIQADGRIVVAGVVADGCCEPRTDRPWFGLERLRPNGTLDRTFGSGGKVVTRFAGGASISGIAIQTDGKIVAAGGIDWTSTPSKSPRFALARYQGNGTLDRSFGGDGKVTTSFPGSFYAHAGASDVAIQADGKIVVVGAFFPTERFVNGAFALARYNPDGTLDSTFGADGMVVTDMNGSYAAALAIQADGKIVAAGGANRSDCYACGDFALARYESDGTLDSTFGAGGKVTTAIARDDQARDVVIQSDGRIVAAGVSDGSFALARYTIDGTLDSTFGGDGKVTTNIDTARRDRASGLALQMTGKIVAAGASGGRFALARYETNGTLDSTFGGDGKVTTNFTSRSDYALDVAVQTNGAIVAAGTAEGRAGELSRYRFALARYRGG